MLPNANIVLHELFRQLTFRFDKKYGPELAALLETIEWPDGNLQRQERQV